MILVRVYQYFKKYLMYKLPYITLLFFSASISSMDAPTKVLVKDSKKEDKEPISPSELIKLKAFLPKSLFTPQPATEAKQGPQLAPQKKAVEAKRPAEVPSTNDTERTIRKDSLIRDPHASIFLEENLAKQLTQAFIDRNPMNILQMLELCPLAIRRHYCQLPIIIMIGTDNIRLPLSLVHATAFTGDISTIDSLNKLDIPLTIAESACGYTPAHCAVSGGQIDVINRLHELSVSLNVPDTHGETCAHRAALCGNVAIIKRLHELGVPLNVVNNRGLDACTSSCF